MPEKGAVVAELREYQAEAAQSIFDYLADVPTGNPVVAMPTATGKSYVIGEFIRRAIRERPGTRILVLAHREYLLTDNRKKLKTLWPEAPAGIYSAGLKSRDVDHAIIFGGIASVHRNPEQFGHRDYIVIDEAHLLSPRDGGMYQQVIRVLTAINPALRVIGLTATPYRLGQGMLTSDGIFTDTCYDITRMQDFEWLLRDGYLCPPKSKRTATKIDISKVKKVAGEFHLGQLEAALDVEVINHAACQEMVEYGHDRKCWVVFAAGVRHAERIAEKLNSLGVATAAVHSKVGEYARKSAMREFKSGKLRCLVNNNILTTGFDHEPVDFIGMLRPTTSTSLWVQMIGRGMRPWPGKDDCLVLDFAGNTMRLGPIDDPLVPMPKGDGGTRRAPAKVCEQCNTINHASAKECKECGAEFPPEANLDTSASDEELLRSHQPLPICDRSISRILREGVSIKEACLAMDIKDESRLERFSSNGDKWWRMEQIRSSIALRLHERLGWKKSEKELMVSADDVAGWFDPKKIKVDRAIAGKIAERLNGELSAYVEKLRYDRCTSVQWVLVPLRRSSLRERIVELYDRGSTMRDIYRALPGVGGDVIAETIDKYEDLKLSRIPPERILGLRKLGMGAVEIGAQVGVEYSKIGDFLWKNDARGERIRHGHTKPVTDEEIGYIESVRNWRNNGNEPAQQAL